MINASAPNEVLLARVQLDPGAAVSLRRRAVEVADDVATVAFSDVDTFATELVQYAERVLVLEPESLRLAVIERLIQIAGRAS
jgi:predicted DNA-binding transcriptional regulator YafY